MEEEKKIPESHYRIIDVKNPRGIVQVCDARWFWCVDGLPEKAIFYIGPQKRRYPGSPQCNENRQISERIIPGVPNAQLVFVPRAFVPWTEGEQE